MPTAEERARAVLLHSNYPGMSSISVKAIDAVLAAIRAAGLTIVPVEPSEAMWQAGRAADAHPGDSYTAVWHAMLAAANQEPPHAGTDTSGPDEDGTHLSDIFNRE